MRRFYFFLIELAGVINRRRTASRPNKTQYFFAINAAFIANSAGRGEEGDGGNNQGILTHPLGKLLNLTTSSLLSTVMLVSLIIGLKVAILDSLGCLGERKRERRFPGWEKKWET